MTKRTIHCFLASSSELAGDRADFAEAIRRKNDVMNARGIYIQLHNWETAVDTVSPSRKQDDYNAAIRSCDLFVLIYATKVGKYTREEFETAWAQFKTTETQPRMLVYKKKVSLDPDDIPARDLSGLAEFKTRLEEIQHFPTQVNNIEGLLLHFDQQLDKLDLGFQMSALPDNASINQTAHVSGSGASAQGDEAIAAGAGGVVIRGDNTGPINTGTQTFHTDGGAVFFGAVTTHHGNVVGRDHIEYHAPNAALDQALAPLLAAIRLAPASVQAQATQDLQQLKAEAGKGAAADKTKVDKLVEGLIDLVPAGMSAIATAFATPMLGAVAGPVTQFVLKQFNAGKGSAQ